MTKSVQRLLRLACLAAIAGAPAALADEPTIALPGSRSAALSRATDLGAVADTTAITGTRLLLARTAAQQAAFDALAQAQQDPSSPLYHRWLTATEIGADFGPSQATISRIADWLTAQGFSVGAVSPTRMTIAFSGVASAVQSAFHAAVHFYQLDGRQLDAFSADPQVPTALAGAVAGVIGLSGAHPEPQIKPVGPVVRHGDGTWHAASGAAPAFTTTYEGEEQEDVAPADYATIYNVTPLRTAATPTLGAGQSIAVVEDSDIQTADWNTFRSAFGLSGYTAATLTVTHPGCSDPGRNADEVEAALDAEWTTAVAPDAAITLASCSDASGGIQASLQGLVDAATPPHVISVSFGECESELGAAAASSWADLVEQGATEGVSIFVSTGDSGSAGCDQDAAIATHGYSVNGLASSPYDVGVGGTDFDDFATNTVSTYWNTTNTAAGGSARSYVPEIPWNDTCANPVLAAYEGSSSPLAFCNTSTGRDFLATGGGGGGRSTLFAKPSFQSTAIDGMPNDGTRDLPDVVSFAANGLFGHALLYCMSDASEGGSPCTYSNGNAVTASSAGGTSFAAPAFAGIQALIDQHKGAVQGNPDARLYALAGKQYNTADGHCVSTLGNAVAGTCLFYNASSGGNDQACRSGSTNCYAAGHSYGVLSTSSTGEVDAYDSTGGYDLANGLGSVNVTNLVSNF